MVGDVWTIEFQKRGLPHRHILIVTAESDKPRNADDYDVWVSAEIPDPTPKSLLHDTISRCMVHGPCGLVNPQAPCMIDGKCSKGYPKLFSEDTRTDGDGFPSYRRRDNGRHIMRQGVACDNRWIVLYNRYLLVKYNAHINVEICSTIKSVKYLFKYVHKGHDRALAQFQLVEEHGETLPQIHVDEIQEFLDSRYVSSSEASFRIFGGNMHGHSPVVIRLAIHLPNQHLVVFQDNSDLREHLQRAST